MLLESRRFFTWLVIGSCLWVPGLAPVHPAQAPLSLTIIKSQHVRLPLPVNIQRVAVADSDILAAEIISSRELLLLGKASGRTTLIVWLTNDEVQEYLCTVRRDLSVLQMALARIHSSIDVESAPDRDALILTGNVPDVSYSQAAEAVARNYLLAAEGRGGAAARPFVRTPSEAKPSSSPPPADGASQTPAAAAPETQSGAVQEPFRVPAEVPPTGTIINLITLQNLPPLPEQKIKDAIRSMGGEHVTIRRVLHGTVRDDARDVLVLEGSVPNQVALVRILSIAAQVFTGQGTRAEDLRVVADEAGSLAGTNIGQGAQGAQSGGGGGGGFGGMFGGGSRGSQRLTNQVRRNLGRAKLIEAAGGRILSVLEVTDLPQVRINIRLYEINRSKLRTYNSELATLASDFNQPALLAGAVARAVQGTGAATVGGNGRTAFQSVLGFLQGTLSNEVQIASGHFAVDALLTFLERRSLARSLSSPSLTVLSGEIAQFQVGGEIPIPEAFAPGFGGTVGTTAGVFSSVTFRQFGVDLGIRPLVGDDGEITLDVTPEVIVPDTEITQNLRTTTGVNPATTAFRARTLRTSTRLHDGQSLLIGGLLSRNSSDIQKSTPGLRDIPGLGWLFKNFDRSDEELELIVMVNPVVLRDPKPEVALWDFPDRGELSRGIAKPSGEAPNGRARP